jgi:ribosomal protein L40E
VFSGIDRAWFEPGLVLLASIVMVICLLSKWVDSNISSSFMNIFGQNNVPAGITVFNAVKLFEAAISGTKGDVFIVVPYLLIALSIAAIVFFCIAAKEIFNGNAEAKSHEYSHFKKACTLMFSVMTIFSISIIVMQAQLNDIIETQWGYSEAILRLEMTASIYLGLVLSIGGLVYVSKRLSSTETSMEPRNVCCNCPAALPKGATFCMACGTDQNAYKKGQSSGVSSVSNVVRIDEITPEGQENVCCSCGEALPQGSIFCAACGVDQNAWSSKNAESDSPVENKICSACGKANVGDSVFCAQCGISI